MVQQVQQVPVMVQQPMMQVPMPMPQAPMGQPEDGSCAKPGQENIAVGAPVM